MKRAVGVAKIATTWYVPSVGAKSTAGVAMSEPVILAFTTADTDAPSVTVTVPAASATGGSGTERVTATFAKAIGESAPAMSLSPTVAGAVNHDAGSRVATFTPSAASESLTSYTASVSATGSGGGAMMSAKTWRFTTTTADYSLVWRTATTATQDVSFTSACGPVRVVMAKLWRSSSALRAQTPVRR